MKKIKCPECESSNIRISAKANVLFKQNEAGELVLVESTDQAILVENIPTQADFACQDCDYFIEEFDISKRKINLG